MPGENGGRSLNCIFKIRANKRFVQNVRMQDILCPIGWLLSEASILSVVVGFLYTLLASCPDSSPVIKTSKNVIWLFCSNSLVNCISGNSEFN